jgi:hypothetical protein
MTAAKKCVECGKEARYPATPHSSRPTCRSCYLAHLKRLAAIYGGANLDDQRQAVVLEIRRVEEDQR